MSVNTFLLLRISGKEIESQRKGNYIGAPITEFVIESVLRDGLGDLKANPSQLDDIFSRFLEAWGNNQYGQAKIDSIKTYIANNQIKLVQAWQQVPTTMPCISIQLTRSEETQNEQNLSNEYLELDTTVSPQVFQPTITPGTYDLLTKKMTIINSVDLSNVCPGMIFVDHSNQQFTIKSPISNLSGNKYVTLDSPNAPDLSGNGKIQSSIDFSRTDRRMIRTRETILLGCHAKNDLHLAKFIYYILLYIIKSRQISLINRGIELDAGTGTVFDRLDEFEGNNIFSRFMELHCLTEFVWNQQQVQVFDCFDLTIETNEPNPNSPNKKPYNTSG